jgi:hypothetical protein
MGSLTCKDSWCDTESPTSGSGRVSRPGLSRPYRYGRVTTPDGRRATWGHRGLTRIHLGSRGGNRPLSPPQSSLDTSRHTSRRADRKPRRCRLRRARTSLNTRRCPMPRLNRPPSCGAGRRPRPRRVSRRRTDRRRAGRRRSSHRAGRRGLRRAGLQRAGRRRVGLQRAGHRRGLGRMCCGTDLGYRRARPGWRPRACGVPGTGTGRLPARAGCAGCAGYWARP